MTTAAIVGLKGEVLYSGAPATVKTVMVKGEVLYSGPVPARITAFKAEILYSLGGGGPPPSVGRRVVTVIT